MGPLEIPQELACGAILAGTAASARRLLRSCHQNFDVKEKMEKWSCTMSHPISDQPERDVLLF